MTEQDPIIKYINKFVQLTEAETEMCRAAFRFERLKKRQFIIQPNFVDRHKYFVIEGAIRAYVVDEKGVEHTVQLAIDEWWISDYNSYLFQQPASMFVVAMEDCQVLKISYEDENRLKAAQPKFETFFRMMAERGVAFMQRKFISAIIGTAEERYAQFLELYPQMINRFPQYVIASYLNMTTEFFSKIRNQKVRKKS